jgi:hypothetical protein
MGESQSKPDAKRRLCIEPGADCGVPAARRFCVRWGASEPRVTSEIEASRVAATQLRQRLVPPTTKAAGNVHPQGIVGAPAEWHDTTQNSTTLPLRKLSGGEATQVISSSYPPHLRTGYFADTGPAVKLLRWACSIKAVNRQRWAMSTDRNPRLKLRHPTRQM